MMKCMMFFVGAGGPAIMAKLKNPTALTYTKGNLYLVDGNLIKKIVLDTTGR